MEASAVFIPVSDRGKNLWVDNGLKWKLETACGAARAAAVFNKLYPPSRTIYMYLFKNTQEHSHPCIRQTTPCFPPFSVLPLWLIFLNRQIPFTFSDLAISSVHFFLLPSSLFKGLRLWRTEIWEWIGTFILSTTEPYLSLWARSINSTLLLLQCMRVCVAWCWTLSGVQAAWKRAWGFDVTQR